MQTQKLQPKKRRNNSKPFKIVNNKKIYTKNKNRNLQFFSKKTPDKFEFISPLFVLIEYEYHCKCTKKTLSTSLMFLLLPKLRTVT